ncbi:MAG: ABC transporter substrate-binding protein [Actinobacteria bacterium]|uniref:Unannotated protein n=1 Tax=freshwater metagenome TaxID=449393 RepID=A0A6J7G3S5_9ZZZZ|nr:ABC transporter substrate-binding protein [Actinomycetota bacterium]
MSSGNQSFTRTSKIVGTTAVGMLIALTTTTAYAAPTPAPVAAVKNTACAPEEGVTPTTIKLGFVTPKTGAAAANFAGAWQAAQLRLDQENARGGVNGRKLSLTVYDDASSSSTQTTVATKALQDDHVFALSAATSVDAMYPQLKSANVPITGFTNAPYATDRNAFSVTGVSSPSYSVTTAFDRMKQDGSTKFANINHATPGATNSSNGYSKLIPLVSGISETLRIADEPQGAHDATSTALRIKSSGSDGAYFNMYVDGGISIIQAMKAQGVNLKATYLVGLSDPAIVAKAASSLEGVIGSGYGTVPIGVNNRAVKTYAAGMKSAGLNPYTASAPVGFLDEDLIISGLKKIGNCPTRAALINYLRGVTNYTGGGMLPQPISFGPGVTPNGNPVNCTWFTVVKGSQLVPDAKVTCGKLVNNQTGEVIKS